MFFRKITTKKNGKEYVYVKLIENYRMEGKVKQRVIANFGSIDNLSPDRINYLITSLRKLHNEMDIKDNEGTLSDFNTQVFEIRNALSGTGIKQAIISALGEGQPYELAEALVIKAMMGGEVNTPIQEVCKKMGLINATSLQFYNVMKRLGEEETRILNKIRVPHGESNEKHHKPVCVHILMTTVFEGTSFEMDIPGNVFFPQNYQKQMILLLACGDDGLTVDFEFAEETGEIQDRFELLVNRLIDQPIGKIVVLDSENCLGGSTSKYLVAREAQEIPEQVKNQLDQGSISFGQGLFFNTVCYEQKSSAQMKEIKANLAKVSAGLETIKAEILLGKLNKETLIRKRAESVIKANDCQDMVSFTFNESSQTFNYQIKEDVLKQKNQSIFIKTWVIDQLESTLAETLSINNVPVKTSGYKVISDELKIPPINMYVDYHYSPEIISGHIQLEIIKQQITKAMNKPWLGGEA